MDDPTLTQSKAVLAYETKPDEALPEVSSKAGVYTSFGISTDPQGDTLPTGSFPGSIGKSGVTINLGSQFQTALNTVNGQGGGAVHLRAGTYLLKNNLYGYTGTQIEGDSAATSIINFGHQSINISFTGTSIYTTGTISGIAVDGITVTGSGTSWLANVTTNHQLFIGTRWYKVAAVVGNTTIILSEGYGDNLTFPQTYRAAIPVTDLIFKDVTFMSSGTTALTFSDCRSLTFENVKFIQNNVGIAFTNCSEIDTKATIVVASTSDGVQMTNVGLTDLTSLECAGNGGNGITLNNVKTMTFIACAADSNVADGINATTAVDCLFKYECRSNGGQGIEFVSGCTNCFINDSLIRNNASDGIKFTASATNNTIGGAINIVSNGGYGINIVDTTSTNNTIISPYYSSNTSGNLNDGGLNTVQIPGTTSSQFTADEAIAAGSAVAISLLGASGINQTVNNATTALSTGATWAAQTFTTLVDATSIVSVLLNFSGPNIAGNDTINCGLYNASGNLPTGAALATQSASVPFNQGTVTFTFTNPVSISPSTQYAYVFWLTGVINWTLSIPWSTSSVYSGGQASTSSNTGATWTAQANNDLMITDIEYQSAHVANANATTANFRANAFIGFAPTAIANGAVGNVVVGGIVTGLSSLIPGTTYFLQNANGTIGTAAGAQSRKIGLALSSTTLLIKHDNP